MTRSTDLNRRHLLLGAAALGMATPMLSLDAAEPAGFRIGALNALTGVGQSYGPGMQKMIQAGAEMINAAGGAGGRRLEVFTADDQSLPEPAVLAARKLVSVNGVQAILGTLSSPCTLAVMHAVTLPNHIIHMHCSGAEDVGAGHEDIVFKFGQTAGSYGAIYARAAQAEGFKNPVILQLNNDSAQSLADRFIERWVSLGHAAPPRVVYDGQRATYRSELQTALRNNPDVIILAAYLEDCAIIFREWYQTGLPTKFIVAPYSVDERLITTLGKTIMQGVYFGAATLPQANPAFAAYDAAYHAAMAQSGLGNRYGAMCWDMVTVLALAMEIAGPNASPVEIASHIREVTNPPGTVVGSFAEGRAALKSGKIKYVGASSMLDFDKNGIDQASDFVINVIEDGKVKMVRAITDA